MPTKSILADLKAAVQAREWQIGWGFTTPKYPKWPMLIPSWDDELDVCDLALEKSRASLRLPAYFLGDEDKPILIGTPLMDSWEAQSEISAERFEELSAGVYQAKKKNGKLGKKMQADMAAALEMMGRVKTMSKSDLQAKFGGQYVSGADDTASSDEDIASAGSPSPSKPAAASAPARGRRRASPAAAAAGSTSAPARTARAADAAAPSAASRRRSRRSSAIPPSALPVPAASAGSDSPPSSPSPWSAHEQYAAVDSTGEEPGAFVLGWGADPSTAAAPAPLHPCIVFPPSEASEAAQAEWGDARGAASTRLLVWWCADGSFGIIKRAAWRPWSDANTQKYAHGVSLTQRCTERAPNDVLCDEVRAALARVAEAGWGELPRSTFLDKLYARTHEGAAEGPTSPASSGHSEQASSAAGEDVSAAQGGQRGKKRSRAERAAAREALDKSGCESGSDSGSDGQQGRPAGKAARTARAAAGAAGSSLEAGDTSEESDDDVPLSAMAGGAAPPTPAFTVPLPPPTAPFSKWVDALRLTLQHAQRSSPGTLQYDAGLQAASRVLTALPAFPRITLAEAKRTAAPSVLKGVIAAAAATGKHAQLVALGKRARDAWKVVISRTEAAAKAAVPSPSPAAAAAQPPAASTNPAAGAGSATAGVHSGGAKAGESAAATSSVPTTPQQTGAAGGQAVPARGNGAPQMATSVAAGLACALRVRNLRRLHMLLKLVLGTFPQAQGAACPIGAIARRLELRVAATVGTPVSSSSDKRLAQWAYLEQAARTAGLPAVFLHVDDPARVPSAAVPASASTSPMASLLSATEWRDARKDARAAYTHGMQVLWSTVAQCSAEPITMGASRPSPPPAAAWAGTARAGRMAQLSASWTEHFPQQLCKLTATPPSAPGLGPLKPSTEDSLAAHVAYMAAWTPPWLASTGGQGAHPKCPPSTATPSTHAAALRAISKRVPQPSSAGAAE